MNRSILITKSTQCIFQYFKKVKDTNLQLKRMKGRNKSPGKYFSQHSISVEPDNYGKTENLFNYTSTIPIISIFIIQRLYFKIVKKKRKRTTDKAQKIQNRYQKLKNIMQSIGCSGIVFFQQI